MIYLIKKSFVNEKNEEVIYYKFYYKLDDDFIEVKINDYFAKKMLIKYAIKNNLVFEKFSDIN